MFNKTLPSLLLLLLPLSITSWIISPHIHHRNTKTASVLPPSSSLKSSTTTTALSSSSKSEEYSVTLPLPPLGIVFEDISPGYPPKGVKVVALTSGGAGEKCGKIELGDVLTSVSAVKFKSGSSNFDVVMVDCTVLDFDTVVSAITSNQEKFRCDRVEMTFRRDLEVVSEEGEES
mmetsp:Transcript_28802/g.35035  ORF Transcript_28802/g.35035 Transcript_28802/m.35035 type:complete len:175 (-) Transcript_28802:71-595(-)|eukprot:CAMPEP_0172507624 /NCGR_PEP_ID=MMETSP1066-20121228/205167_1 /TAXON_ID=671091 /ORGANISM="Coscinodiscus wailesii, Strain CCMP2513" /LENGTH=174 /DNA_ID=CAMNT_0013285237 /DNA_START=44 /DNA_END=568 /DNA_ORIENTATION=+